MPPHKTVQLYELCGEEEERVFSPYCFRARLACLHKGLKVETIPWHFIEKERLEFSGSKTVPVLVNGEKVISDSWEIAKYLEKTYPDEPSLFGGEGGESGCVFVNAYSETVLDGYFALLADDVCSHLTPADQVYFRETREAAFGASLKELAVGREEKVKDFHMILDPLRRMLEEQPYLGGAKPNFSDYSIISVFMTARACSPFAILDKDDIVYAYVDRMLNAFNGELRKGKQYDA